MSSEEEIQSLKPFIITPSNLESVIEEGYQDLIFTGKSYFAISIKGKFAKKLFAKLEID